MTRSEACGLHGLKMPMPDVVGRCWYCARDEPGPWLSIPNDDPSCRCALEPGETPEGAVVVTAGEPDGPQFRVALHADCPHHGAVVRQMTAGALRHVSAAFDAGEVE